MISAPGYRTLITHLFFEGDEFLESEAVLGLNRRSLFRPELKEATNTVEYNFGLARELRTEDSRSPSFVAANNKRSLR
jgi:catechol 1,2-dioxygenase